MKKLTAWLLTLCLVLGLTTPALAAQPKPAADNGSRNPASVSAEAESGGNGFLSKQFLQENSHRFQADDVVRAIVIMESAPLTETRYSVASADGRAYTNRLQTEKRSVYTAMRAKHVDYDLAYTFDTLVNGFSCDVAYGDLATIAALPGVKSVHIANVYTLPTTQEPSMSEANGTTGNTVTQTNGYTGQGMVVAVLDSGTNLDHVAFQAYDNLGTVKLTASDLSKVDTAGQYINAKVPFAYDYADNDNDATDDGAGTGGHGTHVAGIAVGYAETQDGEVTFCGAAPGAQLLAMKIFGSAVATTSSDVYFKALEDAMKLGADVVNMSIGSPGGFTYDNELEGVLGNIYEKLEDAGVVVCIAGGNEYSMGEYATSGYIDPSYPDYGTVGSPSTYANNISVASMENSSYPQAVVKVGGESSDVSLTYTDTSDNGLWVDAFGGKTLEYVLITNADGSLAIGNPEDFLPFQTPPADPVDPDPTESAEPADPENPGEGTDAQDDDTPAEPVNLLKGKIVVISRGDISFSEKVVNAAAAGAAGCIVVNNMAGSINMSVDDYKIPAISMEQSAFAVLNAAATKTLYTAAGMTVLPSSTAGQMSDFSSWGTSPSLTMRPNITSVGGNIYSADWKNDDGYVLMSGTSMACPNMAGTFANVLSYLYAKDPTLSKTDAAVAARSLLQSSAQLISDADELLYSVRKQGSGLGRSDLASAAWESGYIKNPIHELGDSDTGSYTFTFTVKNNSDADITYNTGAVVLTDTVATAYNDKGQAMYDYVTLQSTCLYDNRTAADAKGLATVTLNDTVTVAANGEAEVSVTVTLTDAGKAYFTDSGFVNGSFVEGYVTLTADDSTVPAIHASFLGFYGDWSDAPIMEIQDFQDFQLYDYLVNTVDADGQGHTYADYGYTAYDFLDAPVATDVNWAYLADSELYIIPLGSNMLSGREKNWNPAEFAAYDPSHNMLSTNWDSAYYPLLLANPSLLRNAKFIEMVVTDVDTGVEYFRTDPTDENASYIPKAAYNANSQSWGNYGILLWDGTDANGDPLPDGTKVHVTFNATLPYEDAVQENCWVSPVFDDDYNLAGWRSGFELTMDSTAPVIESTVYQAGETADDDGTLTVTATDKNLAAAYMVMDGEIVDYVLFEDSDDDTQQAVFSIASYIPEFYSRVQIGVIDYATNESGVTALLVEDVGAPATITLVSPSGSHSYSTTVGDTFTFPNCTDATDKGDNAEFMFWYPNAIEEPVPVDADDLYQHINIYSAFLPDSSMMVAGDATYYAVYVVGERTVLEQPLYTAYQRSDYSGDWAIVGQPRYALTPGGDPGYRYDDPYVLCEDGSTQQLKALDTSADLSNADYNEFATAAEGIRFTFTAVEGQSGVYTIRNASTGKYLAVGDNNEIAFVDDASDDTAQWRVGTSGSPRPTSVIMSKTGPLFLLFNDSDPNAYGFQVMDNWDEIVGDDGEIYTPAEMYSTFLYECTDVELRDAAYTTNVGPAAQPSTPSASGGPTYTTTTETNSDGSVTTTVTNDRTGEVTATTELPDGGKIEKVTSPDKDVAITVTDAAGQVLAEVEIPAEIPASETRFADVPEGHWADEAIHNMAALEVVNGVGNDRFDVNGNMTRGALATVLSRLSNGQEGLDAGFADVADGQWYADGIAWAAKTGVVTGYSETEFGPNDPITREQLAVMLCRYARLLGIDTTADTAALNGFTDGSSTHDWAADSIAWCVANGILQGKGNATLAPTATATRAEVAVMLQRFIDLMK